MEIRLYHPYNRVFLKLWSLHISLIHSPFPIVSFCSRFLDMVTQHFGSVAASTVRGFVAEQFPLLIVGMRNRSAMEICSVLQGKKCLQGHIIISHGNLSTVFFNRRRVSLTGEYRSCDMVFKGSIPGRTSPHSEYKSSWNHRESRVLFYYFSPETLALLFLSRSQNVKTSNNW